MANNTAGSPATGALSVVGYAPEATLGTYVAPTRWLYTKSNGILAKADIANKPVASGSRAAHRFVRPTKFKLGGAVNYHLCGTMGAPLLKAAFGFDTYLTALAADTVKAATTVTTTAGISTITCTNTAAVTYTVGAWLQVNTGTSAEFRQILSAAPNGAASTVITVGALTINKTAAAGTAVQQIGQHKITTTVSNNVLPTLSVEQNEGYSYTWKMAGTLVSKWNLKAAKEELDATVTFNGTVMPVKGTVTTPAPSAAELADAQNPYTITDSQFVAYGDPLSTSPAGTTGPSAQQMLTYVEDWEFDWDNGVLEKALHDQSQIYKVYPGIQNGVIKYNYVNVAGRQSEFEDFVSSLANATIPICGGAAVNQSTTSTAKPSCWGFYAPAVQLTVGEPKRSPGDVITSAVEGVIVPNAAQSDLVTLFVANGDTVAY